MKKKIIIFLLLLFAFICVTGMNNEKQFLDKYNKPYAGDLNQQVTVIRDGYDLPPLERTTELDAIASLKCDDMKVHNYFGHKNAEGKQSWEVYDFGTYKKAGENLAFGYLDAYSTVLGWRDSPTHLENLVDPAYTEVGYAVCKNKQNNYLIVQILRG